MIDHSVRQHGPRNETKLLRGKIADRGSHGTLKKGARVLDGRRFPGKDCESKMDSERFNLSIVQRSVDSQQKYEERRETLICVAQDNGCNEIE